MKNLKAMSNELTPKAEEHLKTLHDNPKPPPPPEIKKPTDNYEMAKDMCANPDRTSKDGLLTTLLKIKLEQKAVGGLTNAEHLIDSLIDNAAKGNAQMMSYIFERAEGKVAEKKEITISKPMIVFDADYSVGGVVEEETKAISSPPEQEKVV